MALFSRRRGGYKIGMVLTLIATVLALYGVLVPGWLLYNNYWFGLWFTCSSYVSSCDNVDLSLAPGLFIATAVFCLSSTTLLLIASVFAITMNCCAAVDTRRRTLQVCAIWGGVKLFVACMLFVGQYNDARLSAGFRYGPSFIVTVIASILAMIGGVLVSKHSDPIIPYTSFIVGADGAQTVQQQYGSPVQPANIYYTGVQVSYTSNVAGPPPPHQASPGAPNPPPAYSDAQFGTHSGQEVKPKY